VGPISGQRLRDGGGREKNSDDGQDSRMHRAGWDHLKKLSNQPDKMVRGGEKGGGKKRGVGGGGKNGKSLQFLFSEQGCM